MHYVCNIETTIRKLDKFRQLIRSHTRNWILLLHYYNMEYDYLRLLLSSCSEASASDYVLDI